MERLDKIDKLFLDLLKWVGVALVGFGALIIFFKIINAHSVLTATDPLSIVAVTTIGLTFIGLRHGLIKYKVFE